MSSCGLFFRPVTLTCGLDEIIYRCVMNMWVRAQLVSFMLLLQLKALEFARPFGDFMVLPHDQSIPLWGRGAPASEIKVTFSTQSKSTQCGADGRWRLILNPEKPSAQGRELILTSSGEKRSLKDVLVGEIWLCSGQSNMDFPLGKAIGGKAEASQAENFPTIRLCNLTAAPTDRRVYDKNTLARLNTKDHFIGQWSLACEPSASEISAIAWWTAKALYSKNGIPIGVVENAVGGSGAEAWLPRESVDSRDDYKDLLADEWLECPKIGNWARGRAKLNLGTHRSAMHPFRPGFLFESGVREWSEFPFAGVLWYQGETNAEIANDDWNQRLIVDLVNGWRSVLKQKNLPFFMVQLPRIGGDDPLRAHWPEFRNVQARAAKSLQNVHLIVTEDLGWDSPDVHPPDKQPVAKRITDEILSERGKN